MPLTKEFVYFRYSVISVNTYLLGCLRPSVATRYWPFSRPTDAVLAYLSISVGKSFYFS